MFDFRRLLPLILLISFSNEAFSQGSRLSITYNNPADLGVCGEEVNASVTVRNISLATVRSNRLRVSMPSGIRYVAGSVSGNSVSERNISNLSAPVFDLPDIDIARDVQLNFKVKAGCDLIPDLNANKMMRFELRVDYTGNFDLVYTLPFNVSQPNLRIQNVSNKLHTGDKGTSFVRSITLINSGQGSLRDFDFFRIHEQGLKVIGLSGANLSYRGDTIFSKYDSAALSFIGNRNGWLDRNETIVLYDTLELKDCEQLASKYFIRWGCENRWCNTLSEAANASITNRAPDLRFLPTAGALRCMNGTTPSTHRLRVTNIGNDTARNTVVNITQSFRGAFWNAMFSRIDTSSVWISKGINGVRNKPVFNNIQLTRNDGDWSCLGSDPVGDMAISLANVLPGDTFFIGFEQYHCCRSICNTNAYLNGWTYNSKCVNQCQNDVNTPITWGKVYDYTQVTLTAFTPTDITDLEVKTLNYTFTNFSRAGQSVRSLMKAQFILPKGTTHSNNVNDFRILSVLGTWWTPAQLTRNGDTLTAYFRGMPPFDMRQAELKIKITADCGTSTSVHGIQNYSLNMRYQNDTTCAGTCSYPLFCENRSIRVHCINNCNAGGMFFKNFSAERANFGLADNDNNGLPDSSGSIDRDKIKTERVMVGDTLRTRFSGVVYPAGSTRSWRFGKAVSKIPNGNIMGVAGTHLRVYRRGSLVLDCQGLGVSISTVGVTRTFTIDISIPSVASACAIGTYYNYGLYDSIDLQVDYVYTSNPGGVFRSVVIENEFYLSTVANPSSSSQKFQCDTISGIFQQVGYYFINYGPGAYTHQGCGDVLVTQNYYLSVGNCCSNYAGGNIFPFEYRNWAKVNTFKAIIPKGYTFSRAFFHHYTTGGSNVIRSQLNTPLSLDYQSGDTLVFRMDSAYTDLGGNLVLSDDGFYGIVYLYLTPGCEIVPDKQLDVDYLFDFERKNALGTGVVTVNTANGAYKDRITYRAPDLEIIPFSSVVAGNSDTVFWRLLINNRSAVSHARNVWLAGGKLNGLNLIGAADTNGTFLPMQKGVIRLGDFNASQQKIIDVYGTFSSCNKDSMLLQAGWNCLSYPDTLNQYPCPTKNTWLYVVPENTQLQSRIIDTQSVKRLCDPFWYELEVTNVDMVKAYEAGIDITIPYGSTIVSGTSSILYPLNGSWQSISNPLNLGGTKFNWDASKHAQIKDGLIGISDTTKNSFKIRFQLRTDCNFSSGSFFYTQPTGRIGCGRKILSSVSIGNPIDIYGIKRPYFANLKVSLDTLQTCQDGGYTEIRMINLGPDTTGSNDQYQITLPDGILIDTSYFAPLRNAPQNRPIFTPVNGSVIVSYVLPSGVPPGDSVHFGIKIAPDVSKAVCGPVAIFSQTVVQQPTLCVSSNTMCDINVATGTDLNLNYIAKGSLSMSVVRAESVPVPGGEQIDLEYQIRNSGAENDASNPYLVKLFDDLNNNGAIDGPESLLSTDTLGFKLEKNKTFTRKINFFAPGNSVCKLKLLVDSLNCICDPFIIPIGNVQLQNAGTDTGMCSGDSVYIGQNTIPGYRYRWNPSTGIAQEDSSKSLMTIEYTDKGIKDFFYVLETDRGGCKSHDTVVLSVKPGIKLNLPENEKLCRGKEVIIGQVPQGGSGAFTYQWSPTDSLRYPNLTRTQAWPDTTTIYTLSITDFLGCTSKASTRVEVVKPPQAYFFPVNGCVGEEVLIRDSIVQYSPVDSIHWSFGDGQSLENTIGITHIYTNDGSFTLRLYLRDTNQCEHSYTDTANIHPKPEITLSDTFLCLGDSAYITAATSLSYGSLTQNIDWNFDTIFFSAPDFVFYAKDTGFTKIRATAYSTEQCSEYAEMKIQVHPPPKISIRTSDICLGLDAILEQDTDSASLSLSSFIWNFGDGTGGSGRSALHTYRDTGSYEIILQVENLKGCISADTGWMMVWSNPVADFIQPELCLNDSVFIRDLSVAVHGAINRSEWVISGQIYGTDSIAFRASNTGTNPITLHTFNTYGCSDTLTQSILVNGLPIPVISSQNICENERLLAENTQMYAGIIREIWYLDQDSISDQRLLSINNPAAGTRTIALKLEDSLGCTGSDSINISVYRKPLASLFTENPCSDHHVLLRNQSTAGEGMLTKSELIINGISYPGPVFPDTLIMPAGTHRLQLVVFNSLSCEDTMSYDLVWGNRPQISISSDTFCEQSEGTLIGNAEMLPAASISTRWDLGDGRIIDNQNPLSISYQSAGIYTVRFESQTSANCIYDTSMLLSIHARPTAGFNINPEKVNIVNPVVQIIDQSIGADFWNYKLGDGTMNTIPSFIHEFPDSGAYLITQTVQNEWGCLDSIGKVLLVDFYNTMYFPDAFSPNNDGLNDVFAPDGRGIHSYRLKIFNRWGECVFDSENSNQGWDGTYKGQEAMPGMYAYTIEIFDHKLRVKHLSGSVVLLR